MMQKKIICIAGKNDIAVNILDFCIKEYIQCEIKVICNRDDLGEDKWQKSLKKYAETQNVDICELEEVYEVENLIFLSIEFDRIIDPNKFKSKNLYNIHFSLLPKYKGCHTSVIPILMGEKETGVTFHKIDEGIDTGDIIAQKKIKIEENDTSFDLYKKCMDVGEQLLKEQIPRLIRGDVESREQKSEDSTYFSRNYINYSKVQLNVYCTACQIKNQIRAFAFEPYQFLNWKERKLVSSDILSCRSKKKPGTVLEETEEYLIITSIDFDVKIYKEKA